MSFNQLKVNDIQEIYLKIYKNACELIEEAEILYKYEKYARAYLCAHIAIEEFGKLPMLFTVALRVYNKEKINWKELNKRLRNHKSKTSTAYALMMMMENAFVKIELRKESTEVKDERINMPNNDLEEFKAFIESDNLAVDLNEMFKTFDSADFMEDFKIRSALSEMLNDYKNHSLYADYFDNKFVKPSDVIDEERSRKRIILSLIQKKIIDISEIPKNGFRLFKFDEGYYNILHSKILDKMELDKK
ncbi:AbiV family abortive infection protein [Neobacillus sp. B4I6]|uniref:AbiV family abortive infection protein n=1 Tax=Neobacillus sp. B4I6 TaxID=3373925 RepID=UPI003D20CB97